MKKWFKSKFNEIGEKAVDSMVNLIFSKNDTPINYFNQTPLINAITKSVNSKVTVKQSNTKLLNNDLDKYPPICELDLLVSEGIFLLISDGNMNHTKYFSNVNRNVSVNSSNASSNLSTSNFSGLNESEQEKYSMGPIRHSMIVDEKKSKIEFDSVGPVKPYFCRYKLEVEMNNKHYTSDKKNMQEDFNRVIFDYSFSGKVYNINTDVLISLWCDLDMNKYSMSQAEDVVQKKQFQPRKISSVQCPSIYAPRNSANSHRSGASSTAQDSNSTFGESPMSQMTNDHTGFDDPQYDNNNKDNKENNKKENTDKINSSTTNNNNTENTDSGSESESDTESEDDKNKKDKKKKDKKEKKKKKKKDLGEFDIEEFLLINEDYEKESKSKDEKNSYSRKLGRAMISVPLLLSSFKPEGSLDIHEDLKFLLKYSKRVLSVNMENFRSSKQSNDHTSNEGMVDKDNKEKGNKYNKNNQNKYKENNNNNEDNKENTDSNNFIMLYSKNEKVNKDKEEYKMNTSEFRKGSRYTIRSCFWLQLLPFNENDDYKFVRPYCGYPCFGMRNPVDSIGFLLVTVQLSFDVNVSLLPILNNMVPHEHCWTVAKNFELFHVSAVADRFVVFFTNMPIWVTRLLLGGTHLVFNHNYIDDYIKRKFANYLKKNKFSSKHAAKPPQPPPESKPDSKLYNLETCELDGIDLLFILPFWFLMYELIVLCSLWKMPLVLFLMLLLILCYYQVVMNRFTDFGDRISMLKNLQPHGLLGDYVGVGRTKYKSCTLFSNDNSLLYSLDNLSSARTLSSRSGSSVPESFVQSLASSRPTTPTSSNRSSRSSTAPVSYSADKNNTDSMNNGLSLDKNNKDKEFKVIKQNNDNKDLNLRDLDFSNLDSDSPPRSMASQLISNTKYDNNTENNNNNNKENYNNKENTCSKSNNLREKERTRKNTNGVKERKEDKFNNSLFENHLYKKFKLINRFGVVANDSLVATPFGSYRLNFLGLGEEYPIFSDDLGDFDLKEFVKAVLISLKYFQQTLGYICTAVEKVRFSLDTGYYPTTVLTLFLLFLTLVPLSLFLKLLSRLSLRTVRFGLFLYILVSCMKPHIKVMMKDLLYYSSRFLKLPVLPGKKGGVGLLTKLFYLLKSVLYLVKEFYKNWLLGLPDHREVDHRKICVLQTVPSLCHLLPKDYEIDWRYFKKQFKTHYKAFENSSKLSGVDMKVYAKCKSMIERTVLDEYLSSSIPNYLSGD